jgi:DNA-binding MarR family transcriptional regulator
MISGGQGVYSGARCREISSAGYRQLAEFRYRIRQFPYLSEEAARLKGIKPHQHQVLLSVKGLPEGTRPNVRMLSQRLYLCHHSTLEIIDRLVELGAVARRKSDRGRREVLIELTPHGEKLLHQLSVLLWQDLRVSGPALSESLLTMLAHSMGRGRGPIESARKC